MAASPRVYISATTGDLDSLRQLVKETLLSIDCVPVEQTNFPSGFWTVRDLLHHKISDSQAVLHIAGRRYGDEHNPEKLPDNAKRQSYTQMEYEMALELQKKVYVFYCSDRFPFDECERESDQRRQLQQSHCDALMADERACIKVDSKETIVLKVRELQDDLRAQRGFGRNLAIGVVGLIVLLAAVIFGLSRTGTQVEDESVPNQTPIVVKQQMSEEEVKAAQQATDTRLQQRFIDQFLEKLIREKDLPVEAARSHALADLPKFTGLSAAEIQEITQGRIADLSKDGETPLERARAKLTMGDYEGVLAEAAGQRPETRELAMLAGSAALVKFRDDPQTMWIENAASHFLRAVELSNSRTEPIKWVDASIRAAFTLNHLTRIEEAEDLLRRALAIEERRKASFKPSMSDLEESSTHSRLAIVLNILTQLVFATNNSAEAEPMLRRALALDVQSYGSEHPFVATDLNNLALFLHATNKLTKAEPLYRRAIAIEEKSYGTKHPLVALRLYNLTELLLESHQLGEAEPLLRRELAIRKVSLGEHHQDYATSLSNLCHLLRETNRTDEAEPLMRQVLDIYEKSLGPAHHWVATALNNLALLLEQTNRPAKAERLFRRALAIDEQFYGSAHFTTASHLSNLAQLLKDTDRLTVAIPLMRRAVAIGEQAYGDEHPNNMFNLNSFAQVLQATEYQAEAEPLLRQALTLGEKHLGAEHPQVAGPLSNLGVLLLDTDRARKAEPLMRRALEILTLSSKSIGYEHRHYSTVKQNYLNILDSLEFDDKEIDQQLEAIKSVTSPLEPIAAKVKKEFGPAAPIAEVLAKLDEQFRKQDLPKIYFLATDKPIAPHLDELLGRSTPDLPLNTPIARHLYRLLGPLQSTEKILAALDEQYRKQGKPKFWYLLPDEPISLYFDEILGPID